MEKLRTVIIEDESKTARRLEKLLADHCPEVEILATCPTGIAGISSINLLSPDLLFLDIELPDMDGFEVLKQLRHRDFSLIFTTAHDKYATRAFEVSAIHYLLKPIDNEKLRTAVARVKEQAKDSLPDRIENLLSNYGKEVSDRQLILEHGGNIFAVPIRHIIHCETSREKKNNLCLHVDPGHYHKTQIIVRDTLGRMQEKLIPHGFMRVHSSHLINLNYLQAYHTFGGATQGEGGHIVLSNHEQIPVSRSKREELVAFLRCQE